MARRLAHALRSPLWVIGSSLDEIRASPDVASQARIVDCAALGRRSTRELEELANRFDWVGRVQSSAESRAKWEDVVLEWPEVIRRCVEVRCVERRERSRKKLAVDVSIAETVGKGRVQHEACERALAELLDNAACHARAAIRVTADVDGEQLRVRIGDDGPGLPNGGVDAFAPPQTMGPRMGIGLWLVERIAAALQGSVGVEHTGEDGTVMCLRLPVFARLDGKPAG